MTTTTLALLAGLVACVVAVASLSLVIAGLRREVHRLTGRLDATLRRAAEPTPAPAATDLPGDQAHESVDGVAVPVITALTGQPAPERPETSSWRVASVTFAEPLIKVVSFGYALRRAVDEERRLRYRLAMRKELRRQRKLRRHGRLRPVEPGWRR